LIVASTNGIKADDTTYLSIEQQIQQLTTQRDALVQQMKECARWLVSRPP